VDGYDHGALTGLADDDHALYALADKTRPATWVAAADLSARSLADLGTKDHDLLTGLADDDHTQYLLADGTRALTGNFNLGAFFTDIDDISVPANPGAGIRRIFVNTATGELSVRTSGGSTVSLEATGGVTDHGALTGLADDDHTQYALLLGRAGGQSLIGGTGASDNLTLRASSNADEGFVLVDNQEDGVSLEVLRLQSQRATPANLDIIHQSFYQPNSAAAQFEYGRIENVISFVTAGSEGGRLGFLLPVRLNSGTLTEIFRADGAGSIPGFIFNPTDSTFIDFHVRGGAEGFLINADSGLDTVGIGTAAVSGVLLTIEDDTNTPSVEILRVRSTRSVRADDDLLRMGWFQPSDTGVLIETARILNEFTDVTNATPRSTIELQTQNGSGSLETAFRVGRIASGAQQWGLLGSFAARATYSVTNVVTDRTYDANATSIDELADILGTLIADLRTHGAVL